MDKPRSPVPEPVSPQNVVDTTVGSAPVTTATGVHQSFCGDLFIFEPFPSVDFENFQDSNPMTGLPDTLASEAESQLCQVSSRPRQVLIPSFIL